MPTAPDSVTVEVEFTPAVWTDVTAYVDFTQPMSIHIGRSTPFSTSPPGSLSGLVLINEDGRFTPLRQVLADGTTVHPYYPNVVPRKRIRVAYVIAAVPHYRFIGYIKGWPPLLVDTFRPRVTIEATTRDDPLSRVLLPSAIQQTILPLAPKLYWPLTDAATPAGERSGNNGPALFRTGTGKALRWADPAAPDGGETTSLHFNGTSTTNGKFLQSPEQPLGAHAAMANSSLALWFRLDGTPTYVQVLFDILYADGRGGAFATNTVTTAGTFGGVPVDDGEWHSLIYTTNSAFSFWYIDGALTTSPAVGFNSFNLLIADGGGLLSIGSGGPTPYVSSDTFAGNIANVAVFDYSLSTGQRNSLVTAGQGQPGELVRDRLVRFLGAAGLTSGDWVLDTSVVACGAYPQVAKDVITACQDTVTAEGGGAVFYVGPDGAARFTNRSFRKPGAATLTLDAAADLDGTTFTPVYDDTQIVNQVQGTRGSPGASPTPQIVNDATSQTAYGILSESFTSYAATDADVLHNAEDQLAQQRQPAYRLNQVSVDLMTAQNNLWQAVYLTEIGDRLRITNLYAAAAPTTQVDVLVEGWTDTIGDGSYAVTFDTSPADIPARLVWSDTTGYGLWGCDSNTLNAGITNSATTVVIATAAGKPTFTTVGARYPLTIQVGLEHIELNSAPGGAVSPQTFTGVTRGVDGTPAAAQTIGAAVALAPADAWTL